MHLSRSLAVAKMTTLLIMKSLLITKKSNQFRVVKSFNDRSSYAEEIVTANKKGLPLNIVYNLWKPDGSIGHCLLNTVSKNSLETASSTKTVRSELGQNRKDKIFKIFCKK